MRISDIEVQKILTGSESLVQEIEEISLEGARHGRDKELIRQVATDIIVMPDRDDHVEAAALRNTLRRRGVQIGTIDALLAQLALHHDLALLTADRDFDRVAALTSLRLVCRP